ncbi:hypothetical protein ACFWNK_21785 [Streptomyces sp. NPDC058417]|uniref:hypothetical protein n=1 Tax=unclassified Streptomyces TaxID=2593676 RepID=UPI003655BF25
MLLLALARPCASVETEIEPYSHCIKPTGNVIVRDMSSERRRVSVETISVQPCEA